MSTSFQPNNPTFVYDADCGFCLTWIDYFQSVVGDDISFKAYQHIHDQVPEYSADDFSKAVHLIEPDGKVTQAAEATFRMFSCAGEKRYWLWLYRRVPFFARISEWWYQFVSGHRNGFYTLTKLLFGVPVRDPSFTAVRDILIRAIGFVYAIAFISLGVQVTGLIGSRGIAPAAQYLSSVWNELGAAAYWSIPTIFWVSTSDYMLVGAAVAGVIASLAVIGRIWERVSLITCFVLYLSFVSAGSRFFAYQWDALLLEAGFLAVILALFIPAVYAVRALLFKLMVMSGLAKLVEGSGGWHDLTAMVHHFQTQPLPTPVAWYVHQLPIWVHQATTLLTLGIEIVIPFLYAAPRRIRFLAAWITIAFQLGIALTGNYTFFNLLAIVLAIGLFDDRAISRIIPDQLMEVIQQYKRQIRHRVGRIILGTIVALGVVVSVVQAIFIGVPWPASVVHAGIAPLKISNHYGLFVHMTTTRPEIIIQGSRNGADWKTYHFSYKPDVPGDELSFVAPHQPRLDWQMWFAALHGDPRRSPWIHGLANGLLENRRPVTRLLAHNPFPDSPPQYIRMQLYRYQFTSWGSEHTWQRTKLGTYMPTVRRTKEAQ